MVPGQTQWFQGTARALSSPIRSQQPSQQPSWTQQVVSPAPSQQPSQQPDWAQPKVLNIQNLGGFDGKAYTRKWKWLDLIPSICCVVSVILMLEGARRGSRNLAVSSACPFVLGVAWHVRPKTESAPGLVEMAQRLHEFEKRRDAQMGELSTAQYNTQVTLVKGIDVLHKDNRSPLAQQRAYVISQQCRQLMGKVSEKIDKATDRNDAAKLYNGCLIAGKNIKWLPVPKPEKKQQ